MPSRRLVALLPSALCLLAIASGCVAIPAGYRTLDESVLGTSKEDVRRRLVSTSLSARPDPARAAIEATLTATYEEAWTEVKNVEETRAQRMIIVGALPAIGHFVYHSEGRKPSVDPEVIVLCSALGCLTIFWPLHNFIFEPFVNEWNESIDNSFVGAAEAGTPVGWCKGQKETTATRTVRSDRTSRSPGVPLSAARLRLSVPAARLSIESSTASNGVARFDLGRSPVITRTPLQARIEAVGVETPPAAVVLDLPGEVLGRDLDLWAGSASLAADTVYVEGETLDFSTGPAAPPPAPSVRTDLVGRKPGKPGPWIVRVTIENKGEGPLYRVLARSKSDEAPLDKHLLVVGKVGPGQSVTRDLAIPLPDDFKPGRCRLAIEFREANGNAPATEEMLVEVD